MDRTEQERLIAENRRKRELRYLATFVAMAVIFVAIVILNINTGSVKISVGEILRVIFLRQG